MEYPEQLAARLPEELMSDLDDLAERYGYDRSELVRVLLREGVRVVDNDGLDALLDGTSGEGHTATAES